MNTVSFDGDSRFVFDAQDIKTKTVTTHFNAWSGDCIISLINQQKGFSVRNGKINFDTFVIIEGHDEDTCSVEAIISSPDPDNVTPKINLKDTTISIITEYENKSVCGFVAYRIKVPYATVIKLIEMNYGSISVDTIEKSIEKAKTDNGAITINNISGDVHVQSNNGSIQLRNVTGETSAQSRNGKVTVTQIKGSVNARSDNGSVAIHNVTGKTLAKTNNGSITITSIVGNVDAHSDNGKVMVTDIEGDVNAQSDTGSISLSNISHNINAKSDMGSIYHVFGKYSAFKHLKAKTKMGSVSYLNSKVKKDFSITGKGDFTASFVTDMGRITLQK